MIGKVALATLVVCIVAAQSAKAGGMRNPFLNDLRGFDISCQANVGARADDLCASIKTNLENQFGKPVSVKPAGELPPALSGLPVPNRVWMTFSISVQANQAELGARWGSSMRMLGIPAENEAVPVLANVDTPADALAAAILRNTPFHVE